MYTWAAAGAAVAAPVAAPGFCNPADGADAAGVIARPRSTTAVADVTALAAGNHSRVSI